MKWILVIYILSSQTGNSAVTTVTQVTEEACQHNAKVVKAEINQGVRLIQTACIKGY